MASRGKRKARARKRRSDNQKAFYLGTAGGILMILTGLTGMSTWARAGHVALELTGVHAIGIVFLILMFLGSLPSEKGIQVVVKIGDIGNGLMAIPNLLALLLLAREVGRITREYLAQGE